MRAFAETAALPVPSTYKPTLTKLPGKVIADVGCGSGVVAIAAALAGAKIVYACDIDDDALMATETKCQVE